MTNDISDPTMLEKAFEPLNPLMENMTKEMKPFRDYVLDEEDKANVSKALMGFMTALNKFMGASRGGASEGSGCPGRQDEDSEGSDRRCPRPVMI